MNFSISGPLVDKKYQIEMPDGSLWEIPVLLIALDRARYYAKVDDVDLNEALNDDTIPLFEADEYEIEDWAKNNMDWKDVSSSAICVSFPGETDFQEGWVNGEVKVVWRNQRTMEVITRCS